MYLWHQKEHVLEHLSAKLKQRVKKDNVTEAIAVHITVSHNTDQVQINKQLNLIYKVRTISQVISASRHMLYASDVGTSDK